jgi:hypothetical protein
VVDLDENTLIICIQSVNAQIKYLKSLLTSETLRDDDQIEDLILSYQKAAAELKREYLKQWDETSNMPRYEELIK